MDKVIREKITKILIEKPINLIGTNYNFFCKEAQVYEILFYKHNKVFVSSSGICFNKFGQLLPGSFMHLNRVKKDQKKIALFNLVFRRKQRFNTDKIYFIVHNQWSVNGFYHWMVDSIPRLLSVLNSFKDAVLLLPESAKRYPFIMETIRLLHVQVEFIEPKSVAYVKKLLLPSHLPYWGNLNPNYLVDFKDIALKNIKGESGFDHIYISRAKATRRKIKNEPEVTQYLEMLGFKTIILEELQFSEQVNIFSKAKIAVSIHGAGLTNIIFMKEGTSVLEIIKRPDDGERYVMEYQRLASFFKLKYYCLPSETFLSNDSFDRADLIINMDDLEKCISEMVSKKIA